MRIFFDRLTAYLCAVSIFYTYTIVPVSAQMPPPDPSIIIDPDADVSFRPEVWYNGGDQTPIVDITAPQNGVSHNRYEKLDVDGDGIVLNNATQEGLSVLAGTLRANPNLQGLAADIIINEVTSGRTSELSGAIEVFGQSADVIVANPNGVTANGASFINTNRATLTTGVPVIGGGGSVNLEVRDGQVVVGRQGVDGAGASDVQIVGRAVSIDGPISANDSLIVSGGAQNFDPVTGDAVTVSPNSEVDSSFAIDASAYGVMQADSIKIMGNETGLGVRALGNLSSQSGGTEIVSLDDLFLGSSDTTGDLTVRADGDLTVTKDTTAQGDITLLAGADGTGSLIVDTPTGTGGFFSGGTATLSAGTDVSLGGDIQVLEDLNVTGQNITSDAEVSALAGNINLEAVQNVDVSAGRLSAAAITIVAGDEVRIGDTYIAATDVNVSATDVALGENVIFSSEAVVLAALEDFENASQLVVTGDDALNLSLSFTQDFRNLASGVYLWDAIDLTIAGNLTNAGWIQGNEGVLLALGSLNNLESGVITGSDVAINTLGDFVNVGDIIADTVLSVTTQKEIFNTGRLSSGGNLSLDAVQNIRNGGYISSGGNIGINSDGDINTYVASAINRTDAAGASFEVQAGVLVAGGEIIANTAADFESLAGTILQAGTLVGVTTGGSFANHGVFVGGVNIAITSLGYLYNYANGYIEGGDVNLSSTASQIRNMSNGVVRGDTINVDSAKWFQNQGAIVAGNDFSLISGDYLNNFGLIDVGGNASIASGGGKQIYNLLGGVIDVDGDLSVSSDFWFLNNGLIDAGGDIVGDIAGQLNQYAGAVTRAGGDIALVSGIVTNKGVYQAGGDVGLQSHGLIYNYAGGLISGANVTLGSNTSVVNNFLDSVISTPGVFTANAAATFYDNGTLDAGLVDLNAGRVETRRGGNYTLNGTVNAKSYYANVGGVWQDSATSVVTIDDGSNWADNLQIIAGVDIVLRGGFDVVGGVNLTAGDDLEVRDASSLISSGDLTVVTTDSISNHGTLNAGGAASLTAGAYLYNYGLMDIEGNASLISGGDRQVYNLLGGVIDVAGDLSVQSDLWFYNDGLIDVGGNIVAEAVARIHQYDGAIMRSGGDITLTGGDIITNNGGQIIAGGSAMFTASGLVQNYNGGSIQANQDLVINAGTYIYNFADAAIAALGDVTLNAISSHVRNNGSVTADRFNVSANTYFENVINGVEALNGISVYASHLVGAQFDGLRTTGDFSLALTTGDIIYNPSDHEYSGDLYLNASSGDLTYFGGDTFNGNLGLIAGNSVNLNGDIHATGDLLIDTNSVISLQNTYSAGADLYLFAQSLVNEVNGTLQAGNSLIVDVEENLYNFGRIKGDLVSLSAGGNIENAYSAANALPLQSRLSPDYNQFWQAYLDLYPGLEAALVPTIHLPHIGQSGYVNTLAGAAHHHYTNHGRGEGRDLPLGAFTPEELLAFEFTSGTISGNEVYLDSADGNFTNNGRIHGEEIVSVFANSLVNTGSITSGDFIGITLDDTDGSLSNNLAVMYAGGDIYLDGSGDFTNSRGSIISDGSFSAVFEGDINNLNNAGPAEFIYSFRHADIVAGTQLWLEAAGNITNHGGRLAAGEGLVAIAGGNISNIARRNYTIINDDYVTDNDPGTTCSGGTACGSHATDYSASEIASGGVLELRAGGDFTNYASHIGGFGDTVISADGNILVESVASLYTEQHVRTSSGFLGVNKKELYSESAILREASLQSGTASLFIDADNDVGLIGAVLTSAGNTYISAGRDILMDAVAVEGENYAKRKGFTGLSYSSRRRYWNNFYIIQPEITGYDVSIEAGRDVLGFATYIAAFNDLNILAGTYNDDGSVDQAGDILLDSVQNVYYEYESGFSFGLSFPGSNFLDAIITGQNSQGELAKAYLNENPFFSSMYGLANSDTGAEAAFNLVNTATRGAAFGSRLLADPETITTRSFVDGLEDELNPFSGLMRAFDGEILTDNTNALDNLASVLTINFSTWSNTREWSDSVLTDVSAGGDVTFNATQDIQLIGGTQVTAFGDATLRAERDIVLGAAADWDNSQTSSFGASLGGNSSDGNLSVTIGINGANSSSEADYFTVAALTAGGHLDLYAGEDIAIVGGIVVANSANIYAGNDLRIQSLQNTAHSENSNWGVSVDFCPSSFVCGGSVSGGGGNDDRQWTDDVSGIFAENDLTVEVGGLTQLIGGALAAGLSNDYNVNEVFIPEGWTTSIDSQDYQSFDNEYDYRDALDDAILRGAEPSHGVENDIGSNPPSGQFKTWWIDSYTFELYCNEIGTCGVQPPQGLDDRGTLSLTTGSLEVFDLEDTENGHQWSIALSVGASDNRMTDLATTVGGSYATYTKEGITRATISPGEINVTTATNAERNEIIKNLNRNPLTVQVVTRDESFDTGDLFLDVVALKNFKQNIVNIRTNWNALKIISEYNKTELLNKESLHNQLKFNEALKGRKIQDVSDEEAIAAWIAVDKKDLLIKDPSLTDDEVDRLLNDPDYLYAVTESVEFAQGKLGGALVIITDIDGYDRYRGARESDTDIVYQDDEIIQIKLRGQLTQEEKEKNPNASEQEVAVIVDDKIESVFSENVVNRFLTGPAYKTSILIEELEFSDPAKAYLLTKAVQTGVMVGKGGPLAKTVTAILKGLAGEASRSRFISAGANILGETVTDSPGSFASQVLKQGAAHDKVQRGGRFVLQLVTGDSIIDVKLGHAIAGGFKKVGGLFKKFRNKAIKSRFRSVSELLPDGRIPTRAEGFDDWFGDLSQQELELIFESPKFTESIRGRLTSRVGGVGPHHWCMICKVPQLRGLGFTAKEIRGYTSNASTLTFIVPGETVLRTHSGPRGPAFHTALGKMTDASVSKKDFRRRLRRFLKDWQVPDAQWPTWPKD